MTSRTTKAPCNSPFTRTSHVRMSLPPRSRLRHILSCHSVRRAYCNTMVRRDSRVWHLLSGLALLQMITWYDMVVQDPSMSNASEAHPELLLRVLVRRPPQIRRCMAFCSPHGASNRDYRDDNRLKNCRQRKPGFASLHSLKLQDAGAATSALFGVKVGRVRLASWLATSCECASLGNNSCSLVAAALHSEACPSASRHEAVDLVSSEPEAARGGESIYRHHSVLPTRHRQASQTAGFMMMPMSCLNAGQAALT